MSRLSASPPSLAATPSLPPTRHTQAGPGLPSLSPRILAELGHCRVPKGQGTQTLRGQGQAALKLRSYWGMQEKGGRAHGTLKSDSEAISSSSSRVAEEAEMRVCCWLDVTRCGLLISPWLTVMAGLQGRQGISEGPGQMPQSWGPAAPSPGELTVPSLSWRLRTQGSCRPRCPAAQGELTWIGGTLRWPPGPGDISPIKQPKHPLCVLNTTPKYASVAATQQPHVRAALTKHQAYLVVRARNQALPMLLGTNPGGMVVLSPSSYFTHGKTKVDLNTFTRLQSLW